MSISISKSDFLYFWRQAALKTTYSTNSDWQWLFFSSGVYYLIAIRCVLTFTLQNWKLAKFGLAKCKINQFYTAHPWKAICSIFWIPCGLLIRSRRFRSRAAAGCGPQPVWLNVNSASNYIMSWSSTWAKVDKHTQTYTHTVKLCYDCKDIAGWFIPCVKASGNPINIPIQQTYNHTQKPPFFIWVWPKSGLMRALNLQFAK